MKKLIRILSVIIACGTLGFAIVKFIVKPAITLIAKATPKIENNGKVVTNVRELNGFSGISMYGFGHINAHLGQNFKVVVKNNANLQELILTEVEDNVLRIFQSSNTNIHQPTKMNIELGEIGTEKQKICKQKKQLQALLAVIMWRFGLQKSLRCEISGLGNLLYNGEPQLDIETSCAGSVKPL